MKWHENTYLLLFIFIVVITLISSVRMMYEKTLEHQTCPPQATAKDTNQ